MPIRDIIKQNMKTPEQLAAEAMQTHLQQIQEYKSSVIKEFEDSVKKRSAQGVSGTMIQGSFFLANDQYSFESLGRDKEFADGEYIKRLFGRSYVEYTVIATEKTAVRKEALQEYAKKENFNISFSVKLCGSLRDRDFTVDMSNFPKVVLKFNTGVGTLKMWDVYMVADYTINL